MPRIGKFGDKIIPITERLRDAVRAFLHDQDIFKNEVGKELFPGEPGKKDEQEKWLLGTKIPWIGIKQSDKETVEENQIRLRYLYANGKTHELIHCKWNPDRSHLLDPQCPQKARANLGGNAGVSSLEDFFLGQPESFSSPDEAKILFAALFKDEIPDPAFISQYSAEIFDLRKKIFRGENPERLKEGLDTEKLK